ncbi:MAG: hypothetical protein WC197_02565 [Candidatus Gastranaerophilaceae bacterium]|jgi:hypothetical protein
MLTIPSQITLNKKKTNTVKIKKIRPNSQIYRNNDICKITFKGKTINEHCYTDQEYVDAIKYKNKKDLTIADISHRYSILEILFSMKAEKHVDKIKQCIADIKAEESKKAAREVEKTRKFQEEEKWLKEELEKLNAQTSAKEKAIAQLTQITSDKGVGRYNISGKLFEKLTEKFIRPFALDKINKEEGFPTEVPNGIILYGSSDKSAQIAITLAEQVLQDKLLSSFKQVSIKNNDFQQFRNELNDIKEKASIEYEETGQRTIILIKNFDEIARNIEDPEYNPPLNSFLKTYFLDCAESGCTIFATAQKPENIEEPFVINNKRFAIKESIE